MFEVIESNMNGLNRVVSEHDTFEAAKAYVNTLDVAIMEDDPDHKDCADAYLKDGRVVAIQPKGFTLHLGEGN